MNALVNSLSTLTAPDARTLNGDVSHSTTNDACLDLFSVIGASRGKDISALFGKAVLSDSEVALRILQWARDIREGSGERETFRKLLKYLATHFDGPQIDALVRKIPELGRWDDLFVLFDTSRAEIALNMIGEALASRNGLCAKWMPRKGEDSVRIRTYLGLNPKQYRKLVVGLSNTVEQAMCSGDWSSINYSHVPSVASARYQKAFGRNDQSRYANYLASLQKGEKGVKINAGAVYPYDIVRSLRNGSEGVSNEQWKALPDYIQSDKKFMPIIDVSGSMSVLVSGQISAMDIAVSLGLYLAERNKSVFKDQFITFSEKPTFVKVSGSLKNRVDQTLRAPWGMNTNFRAAFDLILSAAVRGNVPQEDMPDVLIAISDMEFDRCDRIDGMRQTAFEDIKKKFKNAGYKMPDLVFWNVNARKGNNPVQAHDNGTAMVSGFSPAIMKSLLSGKITTPRDIMLATVMKDRYNL